MPELPDLEVIREYLLPWLPGVAITSAKILRPIILRNFLGGEPAEHLVGRHFTDVRRRGKFMLFPLDSGAILVAHFMLTGRLRYGPPLPRERVRDAFTIALADGNELRYHDSRDMGKVYLTNDLAAVPGFSALGPDADDPALTLDVFRERIRKYRGEIKGVITNQEFVAGIGNAYADEVCWRARIYPMRRRTGLSAAEIDALYEGMRAVHAEAIPLLREHMGGATDVKVRDFLAVHGKAGEPCPRCGNPISQVTYERSDTNFCRSCQPGLMIERSRRL